MPDQAPLSDQARADIDEAALGEDRELADFQAALLELLHLGLPAAETQARLLAHPASRPFADWVASFDLRAIEVATKITQKFGARADG